jgi:serine/threonine protein kinase/tetratricopeptide (TPR) repeat protein
MTFTLFKRKTVKVVPTSAPLACAPCAPDLSTDDQKEPTNEMKDLKLGTRLGAGGMGVVYKAHHKSVEKTLAVKMLHPRFANDKQVMKRFENEAKAASLLTHVNLASVYDYGVSADGEPYLVMDYVDGQTLQDVLKVEKSLPVPRFLNIFKQVCDALAHAHMKQLVHRDLKPANIMLVTTDNQSDFVKLVDFGIAKALPKANTDEQRLTQTGEVLGSPVYMCPEQCLGLQPDARGDIYSLGCVMYEALVGRPPFLRDNVVQTILAHLNESPSSFAECAPERGLPPELEKIVFKCLEKDPAKRFQTAEELKDGLELTDQDNSEATKRLIAARLFRARLRNWLSNHRRVTSFVVGAAVLIGTAGSAYMYYNHLEKSLGEAINSAQIFELDHENGKAQERWQKAIKLAERLWKPSNTIANLYYRMASDIDDYSKGSLKEESLRKAMLMYEQTGSNKSEYLAVLAELNEDLNVVRKNFKQPIDKLNALQIKATSAIIGRRFDEADRYFDEELKLDRDAWHPRYGFAQTAEARLHTDEKQWFPLEHRANFYYWQYAVFPQHLAKLFKYLGKDPDSYKDRVAVGQAAQKSGDLEGAAVEYKAALQLQSDPQLRKTLQQVRREIEARNHDSGHAFYNSGLDEQILVNERQVDAQMYLEGTDREALDARFRNLSPFKLPDPKGKTPPYGGIPVNMASLADFYAMDGRWSECEFMLKETLRENPMLAAMKLTAVDITPDYRQNHLITLGGVLLQRGKLEEAADCYKYLIDNCFPAIGDSEFRRVRVDKCVIEGYIEIVHKLKRVDEETRAKKLLLAREAAHKTDAKLTPGEDAFSTGGMSGSTYGRPDLHLPEIE